MFEQRLVVLALDQTMSYMRVARAVSEGNSRGVPTPLRQCLQKLESVLLDICLLGSV